MMNQFILQQFKPEAIVPVRAIHAAQTIDLSTLSSSAFQQNAVKKQMFGKNSIVIQLADDIIIPTTTNTSLDKGSNHPFLFWDAAVEVPGLALVTR